MKEKNRSILYNLKIDSDKLKIYVVNPKTTIKKNETKTYR